MALYRQRRFENFSLLAFMALVLLILPIGCQADYRGSIQRVRCDRPGTIPNGSYRLKRNNMLMRITCNTGYQLQGYRLISCIRGKWSENKPVCTKKGCRKLQTPANGQIHIEGEMKAILYCSDEYNLAGNRFAYCNGTDWDRPIGSCRERKSTVQHDCDFETDDICGWVYEPRDGLEWKRVMAANIFSTYLTGPRYDHSTLSANGGHYMLMESLSRVNIPVTLTSPVYGRNLSLKTACCFQFYYFMYGAGVGNLLVVLKPISIELNDILDNSTNKYENLIKFRKIGNQNNLWNEAHFNIEEMSEDFQIVFIAIGGQSHLSDIAIDDVRLMTGQDCRNLFRETHTVETSTEEFAYTDTYASIYDMQSCANRCNDTNEGKRVMLLLNHLIGLCNCHPACEDFDTCCIDYKTLCLNEVFMESTTLESMVDVVGTPQPQSHLPKLPGGISFLEAPNITPDTRTTTNEQQSVVNPLPSNTTLLTNSTTKTVTSTTASTPTTTTTPAKARVNNTANSTTPITAITTTTTANTTNTTTTTTTTTTSSSTISTTVKTSKTTPSTTTKSWLTARPVPKSTLSTKKINEFPPPPTKPSTQTTITTTKATSKPTSMIEKLPPRNVTYEVPRSNQSRDRSRAAILLIACLAFILLAVLMIAVYRRYGDRAAAWSMIYFSPGKRDEDETSCLAAHMTDVSVLQISPNHSTTVAGNNGLRRKTKFSTSKLKLLTNHQNEMKRPLWQSDDDDDDDNDDNDVNQHDHHHHHHQNDISKFNRNDRNYPDSHSNGKLFTEL